MRGPFFSTSASAAKYLGVTRETFLSYLKIYSLPKIAGPGQIKRWSASQLDAFMENPEQFKIVKRAKRELDIRASEVGL